MGAFLVYSALYSASVIFTSSWTIVAAAIFCYTYVALVFFSSEQVGIWYGIPFNYQPESQIQLTLFRYVIPFPNIALVVNGFRRR